MPDGLFTFGTLETVEIPSGGPGLANDPTPKCPVGVLYRHQGNVYRYVRFEDPSGDGNCWDGDGLYWYALNPLTGTFSVCGDRAFGIADINGVAGVCRRPNPGVDEDHYTFIQVGGVVDAVLDAPAAVGAKVIGDALVFNLSSIALGGAVTDSVYGVVIGATNPTTGMTKILLQNLIW